MLRQTLAIVAALMVGLAVFAWAERFSSSFQSCISQETGNESSNNTKKQDRAVIVTTIYARCTVRFIDSHNAIITAIATVLLTIVTGGLVWVGIGQAETSRAQLRAYVFVEKAQVVNVIEGSGSPEAHIIIKNYGQTPAYGLVNVTGFAMDKYPSPPTLNLTIADEDFGKEGKTRMELGPSDISFSVVPSKQPPVPQEIRNAFMKGEWIAYVYGEIRYKDVFGRKQWTKYRLMMGGPIGVRGGQLVGCDEGNKAT